VRSGDLLTRTESTIASVLLTAVVLLVFLAALVRWFGRPLTWSVDLATLIFVWVCFLGADLAVQKHRHIGVELLPNALSPAARAILRIAIDVACMIFAATLAIYAGRLAIMNPSRRFPGMNISYSWATGSAAVGSTLIVRSLVARILSYATKDFGKAADR
jgi:TRAP-type transport system small permease protein